VWLGPDAIDCASEIRALANESHRSLNNFGNWLAYQQFDKADLEAVPSGNRDAVRAAIQELYKEAPSSNPLHA
jgi:hypothetical protein